ncbi:unnamed protein product [Arabis nemorensis]|uniref:Uncharacterized protein n=1 Tax=Arabis nemorensis TaxID=586526 RepID=A0A565BK78_9BRAS|nr:unnamed protein product [Arabis nemorensis]
MERLVWLLRGRLPAILPDLYENGGAPTNIKIDCDVTLFMAVRFSYPELTMCVTVGAEAVATYEFQCRTSFTVDWKNYLVQHEDEEQTLWT